MDVGDDDMPSKADYVNLFARRLRAIQSRTEWLMLFVLWLSACATASVGLAIYALFFRR